jgi:hypothetical protein
LASGDKVKSNETKSFQKSSFENVSGRVKNHLVSIKKEHFYQKMLKNFCSPHAIKAWLSLFFVVDLG